MSQIASTASSAYGISDTNIGVVQNKRKNAKSEYLTL